ncbi:MAG: hypothetical protein GX113_04220 [Actinobacteria bacterium]|jgi:hypothetical protein|nr:hypothetical protein [Actinomycetota bacterium]
MTLWSMLSNRNAAMSVHKNTRLRLTVMRWPVSPALLVCLVALVVFAAACSDSSESVTDGSGAGTETTLTPAVPTTADGVGLTGSSGSMGSNGLTGSNGSTGSAGTDSSIGPGEDDPSQGATATTRPGSPSGVGAVAKKGLAGIAIDFDTKRPVSGARIAAGGATTLSSEDGQFVLAATLQKGTQVDASKEGYFDARALITGDERGGSWYCEIQLVATDSPNAPPPPPGL